MSKIIFIDYRGVEWTEEELNMMIKTHCLINETMEHLSWYREIHK